MNSSGVGTHSHSYWPKTQCRNPSKTNLELQRADARDTKHPCLTDGSARWLSKCVAPEIWFHPRSVRFRDQHACSQSWRMADWIMTRGESSTYHSCSLLRETWWSLPASSSFCPEVIIPPPSVFTLYMLPACWSHSAWLFWLKVKTIISLSGGLRVWE